MTKPHHSSQRPWYVRTLVVLAAMALIAACGDDDSGDADSGDADSGAAAEVTILLGAPVFDLGFIALYVAEGMGYFEEENLTVNVQALGGSTDAFQQVARGGAEFGWGTPEPAIIGAQPGQNLGLVNVYTVIPDTFYYLAAPEDSEINSIADLEGKSIGFTDLSSGAVPIVRGLLSEAGLDPDRDVSLVAIGGGPAALAPLQSGQADVMALWDTQHATLENLGLALRRVDMGDRSVPGSLGVVTTADYVADNGDIVERFGRALARASAFVAENPEAAVRVAWSVNPDLRPGDRPEEVALEQAIRTVSARIAEMITDEPWGYNPPEAYAAYAAFLFEQGVIGTEIDADSIITNDHVDGYNDFDEGAVREQARGYNAAG